MYFCPLCGTGGAEGLTALSFFWQFIPFLQKEAVPEGHYFTSAQQKSIGGTFSRSSQLLKKSKDQQ